MKKTILVSLALSITVANAGFMDAITTEASKMMGHSTSQSANNPLIDTITKSVGIDSKQALGGAGALMGLAASSMPKSQYSSLLKSVPGLSSVADNPMVSGILSSVGKSGVESAFKHLGMSPDTVSQVAPVMLNYISKYATAENLSALKKAWSSYLK